MGTKTSSSAEVEALRKRLADMARADVLKLCARADLAASTIQKFRNREIADIGADKYAKLTAVLAKAEA